MSKMATEKPLLSARLIKLMEHHQRWADLLENKDIISHRIEKDTYLAIEELLRRRTVYDTEGH